MEVLHHPSYHPLIIRSICPSQNSLSHTGTAPITHFPTGSRRRPILEYIRSFCRSTTASHHHVTLTARFTKSHHFHQEKGPSVHCVPDQSEVRKKLFPQNFERWVSAVPKQRNPPSLFENLQTLRLKSNMKPYLIALLCLSATTCYGKDILESCQKRFVSGVTANPEERVFGGKNSNKDVDSAASNIGASVNLFGFDLLRSLQLNKVGEVNWKSNVVASPLSISLVFSLLYDGAVPGSRTKSEIGRSLYYESDACHGVLLRASVNELTSKPGSQNELAVASKIFIDKDVDTKAAFSNRQSIETVDFSNRAQTAQSINSFVTKATNGVITEIVEESSINESDIMSIVNALYFKGQWENKFDPALTREDTFTMGTGTKKTVPFMQQDGEFYFARTASGAYLEMPYIGGRYVMNLFKPTTSGDLENFLKTLDFKEWKKALASARKSDVMVRLPKFEIEASYALHEIFPSMKRGMKRIFTPDAELELITSKGAFVGSAIHKAKIIVNEEGTEAAAVTETRVQPLSAPPSFIGDEPFVYFITDTYNSNVILFMGTVMDPTQ
ncbi:hypothetical protein BSKO_07043 [Bryopsis sp. KO-2023]|nr:hypothetical protein BSKO_07043 [Bryopsis sp. KO-2023]